MSKTVFRYDERSNSLKSPTRTPQGFLRCDGHAARVGIYKYRRADGSTQYELRPEEEVFHPDSLASYDGAPVTIGHPKRSDGEPEDVNAENVRRHEVGTVMGSGRRDGDRVATTSLVKDAAAIRKIEGGMVELSPGYRIRLDETPGHDMRYATPDNPRGFFHARQCDIRINHHAVVDQARGGSGIRLRMDDAEMVLRDDTAGGNPNHDDHGRFAAGSSAAAHSATAAASSAEGHAHAARLHEQAAADHRAAGNGAMAQAHTSIAQHHKGMAAEAKSGHSGPGHEHSERAMEATDKTYRAKSAEHAQANHAAAEAHDTAAAVHGREGNAAAAAEHHGLADAHRSAAASGTRVRPGRMSSQGTSRPEPPHQRYEPPKVSAEAKAASNAAHDAKFSMGRAPTSADHHRVAGLFDAAAAEHRKSGDPGQAESHEKMAKAHRDAAAGVKQPTKYRGDDFAVPEDQGLRIDGIGSVRDAMVRFDEYRFADSTQRKAAYRRILTRACALDVDASRFVAEHRADAVACMTTAVAGHQHLIDPRDWQGCDRDAGETSYAMSEGADCGHSHPWVMDPATGKITVGEADGHNHEILVAESTLNAAFTVAA